LEAVEDSKVRASAKGQHWHQRSELVPKVSIGIKGQNSRQRSALKNYVCHQFVG